MCAIGLAVYCRLTCTHVGQVGQLVCLELVCTQKLLYPRFVINFFLFGFHQSDGDHQKASCI